MADQPTGHEGSTFQFVKRAPLRNRRFILVVLLLLVISAVWIAWPYRAAIVLAFFFGYVLRPIYTKLLRAVRWRSVAAGITLLLVAVAIVTPLALIGWSLVDDVADLRESAQNGSYREGFIGFATTIGMEREAAAELTDTAWREASGYLRSLLVGVVTGLVELILGLVIFFILLFYLLVDGERLLGWFHEVVPLSKRRRNILLAQTGTRVRAILLGTFVVSGMQGVVAGIGWWLFGFPNPVFWGFVMTVLGVLPFIGPQIVTIPAGLIAIAQGDTFGGVGILIYTLVVVSLIDDVIRPYVIGRSAGVHPALILVGILGGIEVFGLVGFLLGPLLLGLVEPVLAAWRSAAGPPPEHDGHAGEPPPTEPPPPRWGRARRAT